RADRAAREGHAEGDDLLRAGGDVGQRHELDVDTTGRLRRREERRGQQLTVLQQLDGGFGGRPLTAWCAGEDSLDEVAELSQAGRGILLHGRPSWLGAYAWRSLRVARTMHAAPVGTNGDLTVDE